MTKYTPPIRGVTDEHISKDKQRAADIDHARRLIDEVFRSVFSERRPEDTLQ
jgi:hypothetical protein